MQHRNTFTAGMKSGVDYSIFPQDSYTYLLNGCIISKDEHGFMVTNVKGHNLMHNFLVNEVPIGTISFNGILYVITHNTEDSTICFYSYKGSIGSGWTNTTGLTLLPYKTTGLIIPISTLGFSKNKLLEVMAKESYDGSVDLYICDGLHINVVINTGIDRDGIFTDRSYPNLTDLSLFKVQKSISKVPTVTSSIINTGNMKPGTYFLYLRYLDDSLNPTPFIKEVGPFFIHPGSKSRNTESGALNEKNTVVNKSIILSITGFDSNYSKISVGVVHYFGFDDILSKDYYLIDKVYTLGNEKNTIIIDGNNAQQTLLLEELFIDNLPLDVCETQEQFEDRYFGANWSGNNVDMSVLKTLASKFVPHAIMKDESNFEGVCDENTSDFEYMEDEIYPLGVSFLIDGQFKTDVFPICGWYEGYDYENAYQKGLMFIGKKNIIEESYIEHIPFTVVNFEWFGLGYHGYTDRIVVEIAEVDGTTAHFQFYAELISTGSGSVIDVDVLPGTSYGIAILPNEISLYNISLFDVIDFIGSHKAYRNSTHWNIVDHPVPVWDATVPEVIGISESFSFSLNDVQNTNGLYKFPQKKQLFDYDVIPSDVHFRKMGLKIDDVAAKQYIIDHASAIPNITEIYFVQGKRQENILCQGVMCASVEAVGFNGIYPYFNASSASVSQSTKLGDGETDCAFPWFDANSLRRFPLIHLHFHQDSDGNESVIWQQNAVTELMVMNKDEEIISGTYGDGVGNNGPENKYFTSDDLLGYSRMHPLIMEQFNVHTQKFCIFSPDILIKNISLPSETFIKPLYKFIVERPDTPDVTGENCIPKYSVMSAGEVRYGSNDSITEATKNKLGTYYDQFYEKRLLEPSIGNYNVLPDTSIRVSTSFIDKNTSYSPFYGFSSRMKSFYEIFGDTMNITSENEASNDQVTQYLSTSRNNCLQSGILINRNKWNKNNNISEAPIPMDGDRNDTDGNRTKRFGNKWHRYAVPDIREALPVIVTNLSMSATPYIAVKTEENWEYGGNNFPYHNSVVNVCTYETIKDYIESVELKYSILNEKYSIINNIDINVNNNLLSLLEQKNFVRNTSGVGNILPNTIFNKLEWVYLQSTIANTIFYLNIPMAEIGKDYRISFDLLGTTPIEVWVKDFSSTLYNANGNTVPLRVSIAFKWLANPTYKVVYFKIPTSLNSNLIRNIKLELGTVQTAYITKEERLIYKGDLFSQKTFMRTIRWETLPENMSGSPYTLADWDYSWKQGQAFNVYLQSFVNTQLRVPSADDTFYPYVLGNNGKTLEEIKHDFVWKNTSNEYLKETWRTNAGYNELQGILKLGAFDNMQLQLSNKKRNRIYYTNKNINGAYVDQYRQFPLLQYQDIGFDNGDIYKIIKFNSSLFTIQYSAINQHYSSQKLQSSNDSSEIILGDRNILSEESRLLATFGTQHKESVVAGESGIYGVDWKRKKLWRVKPSSTSTGSIMFGCEDLLLGKHYHSIFEEMNPTNENLPQDIYQSKGIISTYDQGKHEILITFKLGNFIENTALKYLGENLMYNNEEIRVNQTRNKYYTLIFNEDLDSFTGFYSYDTSFYMTLDNRLFSFSNEQTNGKNIWEHNVGPYQKFYGSENINPLEFEFIINCANKEQDASLFEKDFLSHMITSCPEILESINWTTEWQQTEKAPFIDEAKFWSNPEYSEDKWMVPITKSTKSKNGPIGSVDFSTFEPDSSMKGMWLKVKIVYKGNISTNTANYFYLKNVVTNFLISYT